MPFISQGYLVTGLSARPETSLNESIHFEFHQGTSALYGLNGSGKTSVLRSIDAALSGGRDGKAGSMNDLHIQIIDHNQAEANSFLDHLSTFIDDAISRIYGEVFSPGSIDDEGWYTGNGAQPNRDLYFVGKDPGRNSKDLSFANKLKKFVDLYAIKNELIGDHTDFLESIASDVRLTLRATGNGTWSVWIAGRPNEAGLISEHLNNLFLIFKKFLQDPVPDRQVVEWEPDMIQEMKASFSYIVKPTASGEHAVEDIRRFPEWVQIPLIHLGDGFSEPAVVAISESSASHNLDHQTLLTLTSRFLLKSDNATELPDNEFTKSLELINVANRQIEHRANKFLSTFLPASPEIRFNLRNQGDLFVGLRPCWEFLLQRSDQSLRRHIRHLSQAQLRWAEASVSMALAEVTDRPVIFLCDEPEAGLHRLAERALARGLVDISSSDQLNIVVATHSPHVLDQAEIHKTLISREPTTGTINNRQLDLAFSDTLVSSVLGIEAGLTFSDILQLMRVAVVVEGLHDEIVFARLLRPQLDAAHARLMPIRGAKRLKSLAEARLLFSATEAKILVVVDNIQNSKLDSLWSAITAAAAVGDFELARSTAATIATLGNDEGQFLGELATAALEFGNIDRIEVHGLSQPDVICYLPTASFLGPEAPSWPQIIREWTAKMRNRPSNIKKYLKDAGYLPQDSREIDDLVVSAAESAANGAELLDPDIIALGERIMALSTIRR
ncbi:AAA family ATPase [Rhodococcus sp. BP-149]|uniref:AAA family ATPase n=1 Tax=unclassified Rhodococcus (in: high G+C Gram-positive bacteria) TaxID=192944 RepID=UPI001C9B8CDA|nr:MULTISPECIES: AAA family ATPase [unclassified Rhodococcus (in: high G+C Gram-positive bacteria)]MBY6687228.1 AAA family ATPase [Rhodococcus sp. BP-288]MBY6694349.1 AAA family ATPase [Rhodococcus sp. BP-188]MBY6698058.1 AAA family ATPase [Rhodococcus sp. BP-285]MBY6704278.1 AAA family ATPase [Rhodococcus sp. BP-283]MBY6712927.1 AAA family ATPase [Rhodococcus sp. BP-160]